jgi:hypothetical protein
VATDDVEPPLPLEQALVLLAQAEEARADAYAELDAVLARSGLSNGGEPEPGGSWYHF